MMSSQVSAHNQRRRERLQETTTENANLDHIDSSRRQSPERSRRPESPPRRRNDATLEREKTQEGQILDEFLRQRENHA